MEKRKHRTKALVVAATVLILALISISIYVQLQQSLNRSHQPSDGVPQNSSSTPSTPPNATTQTSNTTSQNETQPSTLPPQEIPGYQGQTLSSLSDARENAIAGTQYIDVSTYRLSITGLVNKPLKYNYTEVVNGTFQKYEKVVTLHCVEGWSETFDFEGILVRDLLNASGIDNRTKVVIFYASDGYSTSLPLQYFFDNDIMIAYKVNGVVLPPERGFPLRLVAESKFGYKWIKWITSIELSDNKDFRGYWESAGYSNDADIG